jgi:hypothetical protein
LQTIKLKIFNFLDGRLNVFLAKKILATFIIFEFNEKYLSQIPALQQLINLGYHYLTPEQALRERGGKTANVILEGILREQLKKINRINYKGGEYLLTVSVLRDRSTENSATT